MVSFTCNYCQDVVKKPKVQSHAISCGGDTFTCVDCMHVFDLNTIKGHTSCVTEEEKYQGKWKKKIGNTALKTDAKLGDGACNGIKRPPRAPMNDLSSSEDSDGSWATRRKVTSTNPLNKKTASAPGTKTHSSLTAHGGQRCPGESLTSDDDEVGEGAFKNSMMPAPKKLKTAHAASPTPPLTCPVPGSAPRARSPADKSPSAIKSPVALAALVQRDPSMDVKTKSKRMVEQADKKGSPLLLPRSTTSTDCIVPSFVLGTSGEVADIVADVLSNKSVSSMFTKDLARELVKRYAKRIAKSVRHAVEAAVELGVLTIDNEGKVSPLQGAREAGHT
ncbi:hypothetical protein JKF63_00526 [Porcisia hertigi]|uniref:Zinc finger C2H2 LYAR-type domain-containing protein n=1 Tax=Porcisia hertigi TaxID=2761500 RepID=A0A836I533_9TRYP|nr:hypothetical protein JKF63_00526 [Porcisia hertigi]